MFTYNTDVLVESDETVKKYPVLLRFDTTVDRLQAIDNELDYQYLNAVPYRIETDVLDDEKKTSRIGIDYFILGVKTINKNIRNKARELYHDFRTLTGYDTAKISGYNPFYVDEDKSLRAGKFNQGVYGQYDPDTNNIEIVTRHRKPTIADQLTDSRSNRDNTPTIATLAHEMVHRKHWQDLARIKINALLMPAVLTSGLATMNTLVENHANQQFVNPVANFTTLLAGTVFSLVTLYINRKHRNEALSDSRIGLYDELIAQLTSNFYYEGIECNNSFFNYINRSYGSFIGRDHDSQTHLQKTYQRLFILASLGYPIKELNEEFALFAVDTKDLNDEQIRKEIEQNLNEKILKHIKSEKILDIDHQKKLNAELETNEIFGALYNRTPIANELLQKANLRCRINSKYLKILSYKVFGDELKKAANDRQKNYVFCPTRNIADSKTDSLCLLTDEQTNKILKAQPLKPNQRLAFRSSVVKTGKGLFASTNGRIGIYIIDTERLREEPSRDSGIVFSKIDSDVALEIFELYLKSLPRSERNLIRKELVSQGPREEYEINRQIKQKKRRDRNINTETTRRELIKSHQTNIKDKNGYDLGNYFGNIYRKRKLDSLADTYSLRRRIR